MIDLSLPWVLLRVRDQLFGVSAAHIREMAEMPAVTRVPTMPEYVMGLVTLRGQVTPALDMRRRLGLPTAEDDIQQLTDGLGCAEAEHHRLAVALESVVRDGRAAGLDSHACTFHEWLGTLQTKSPRVRLVLEKLEEPHAQLHAAATRVAQAAEANPVDASTALRSFREKELAAFTRLLPQVRERLIHAHRQIAVVLALDGLFLGVAVDEVESIERLKNGSVEELPASLQKMKSRLTQMVGRRVRDDQIVLILEIEELFHGDGQVPVHGDWMDQAEETPESDPQPDPEAAPPATPGIAEATTMTDDSMVSSSPAASPA